MFRFALMTVLVCLLSQAAMAVPQKIGIAVVVNQDIITFGDVAARTALFTNTMPSPPSPQARAQIESQVIERLIEEKIKLQEAKSLGIDISSPQIEEGFANIARQNKNSPEEFRQHLRAAGIKPATLEDQIRADIAWSMVVRRKLRPQVNVTDTEIDSEIASITRGNGRKEFMTAEIFLKVPSPDKDTDVLRKMEQVREAIVSGKPFQPIARQVSEAPGAATGGDLGWIEEGQLEPKLNDALMQMTPGQLSQPIRGERGYHLLFLRDVRQKGIAGTATRAPEAAPPSAPEKTTVTRAHIKQIVLPAYPDDPQIVTNAKISRAKGLKDEIKSCEAMDARMKDFTGSGTGDMGTLDLKSLPAEMQTAANDLPDGTLSAPVQTKTGIAVIMICGREQKTSLATAATAVAAQPSAQPTAVNQPTRDDIINKIGLQRLEQLQSRYLNDLKANAVVERRI